MNDEIDRIFSSIQKEADKLPEEEKSTVKLVLLLGEIIVRDIRRIADALEEKKPK